jgi:copper ion binding protein
MISEFTVTGMTCDHCVASVTRELSTISGVTAVAIDLESGVVSVTSDGPLPDEAIQAAIDEAGYELANA